MIKVKNNNGEIIEVTQVAWDVLYCHRDGFELYVEKKKPVKKSPAKKKAPAAKKVKKDESK